MALIYARVTAGTQRDTADRFGVRAGFPGRRVRASDKTREIAVDQERDEWQEFEFGAPLMARPANPSHQNSKAYILHKEPGGSWFVDRWTADGAGALRMASPVFPDAPESTPAPANDDSDRCFIIEIGHAGR
jgi:hypothetical protein